MREDQFKFVGDRILSFNYRQKELW